jgi:hypothetical protein
VAAGLFLEEFGEIGDLVRDSMGAAGVLGRCFGKFAYGISPGTFNKDGLDACGIMCVVVVVGILASDGLDGGMKFASVVFAGCEFDVGQQDDGELRVIYGDAVGMDAGNLGLEKLYVRTNLALKVKFKGDYGSEKAKDVGRVGLVGSLNDVFCC